MILEWFFAEVTPWLGMTHKSSCVVGGKDGTRVVPLTEDHKPDLEEEAERSTLMFGSGYWRPCRNT